MLTIKVTRRLGNLSLDEAGVQEAGESLFDILKASDTHVYHVEVGDPDGVLAPGYGIGSGNYLVQVTEDGCLYRRSRESAITLWSREIRWILLNS